MAKKRKKKKNRKEKPSTWKCLLAHSCDLVNAAHLEDLLGPSPEWLLLAAQFISLPHAEDAFPPKLLKQGVHGVGEGAEVWVGPGAQAKHWEPARTQTLMIRMRRTEGRESCRRRKETKQRPTTKPKHRQILALRPTQAILHPSLLKKQSAYLQMLQLYDFKTNILDKHEKPITHPWPVEAVCPHFSFRFK